jgi:glycine cleavage system H protein
MDGFTYHDIFETKGIEYLIIICFFAILIPFWIIFNKNKYIIKSVKKAMGAISANILRIPQGVYYSSNHTWAYLEKNGVARVGLDDFVLQIVGNVNINHLRLPGVKLRKGEVIAEIHQNGNILKILSPISGEISSTNTLIQDNPAILHEDPYGKGWLYSISPSNWKSEMNNHILGRDALPWLTNELERFKDFLSVSVNKYSEEPSLVAYQEGGEIRQNVLSGLDQKIWEDFQNTFMN